RGQPCLRGASFRFRETTLVRQPQFSSQFLVFISGLAIRLQRKHPIPRAETTIFLRTKCRLRTALLAQPLNGANNSSRNCGDWPVTTYFRESSQLAIVLDNRRSLSSVGAHTLCECFFCVIGSLGQCSAFYITKTSPLGWFRIDVVDGLADWAVPTPSNSAQ